MPKINRFEKDDKRYPAAADEKPVKKNSNKNKRVNNIHKKIPIGVITSGSLPPDPETSISSK